MLLAGKSLKKYPLPATFVGVAMKQGLFEACEWLLHDSQGLSAGHLGKKGAYRLPRGTPDLDMLLVSEKANKRPAMGLVSCLFQAVRQKMGVFFANL